MYLTDLTSVVPNYGWPPHSVYAELPASCSPHLSLLYEKGEGAKQVAQHQQTGGGGGGGTQPPHGQIVPNVKSTTFLCQSSSCKSTMYSTLKLVHQPTRYR